MSQEKQNSSLLKLLKEPIAGIYSGVFQVLIGMPFDTIKVRMQNAEVKRSTIQTIAALIKNEGPLALYKGVSSPLMFLSFIVSIQFTAYHKMRNFLLARYDTDKKNPSLLTLAVSGAFSGLCGAIILGPMEHLRIRQQVQPQQYPSTISAAKQAYNAAGLKGIFKGYWATNLREGPAFAIYFMTYELIMKYLKQNWATQNETARKLQMIGAGAFAGLGFWLPTFQFDTIKTKIQTDNFINPKYSGIVDCFQKTIQSGGVAGLYRGLGVCLMRSMPVNGAGFLAFEMASEYIERQQ